MVVRYKHANPRVHSAVLCNYYYKYDRDEGREFEATISFH